MSLGTGGSTSSGTGGAFVVITATGGATVVGTGGSPPILGGGSGGATTTPASPMDSAFSVDGYGMNTAWKGYVFPAAYGPNATVSPATMFPVGKQVCVTATIGADTPGNSGALIGWNINQQKALTSAPTAVLAAAPTGIGLDITLAGNTTGLRLQIQDLTTPVSMKWCYLVTAPTMRVPWTSFNTTCYDPTNPNASAYTPTTPIKDISVLALSSAAPFTQTFCLIDAKPY